MHRQIGVGFVGAGLVVQSIHLPTLARLDDRFAVRAICDPDAGLAQQLADRVGAVACADLDALLANTDVEVVAICSPARFHADQAIAALRAGKQAVLIEKPLATSADEAVRIAAAAQESGVPLIVGSMHLFDPGWAAVQPEVAELAASARSIRSSILLPFNARFEQWAYEPLPRAGGDGSGPPRLDPDALMRMAVLELAIHDLPLVRALLSPGAAVKVTHAEQFEPFGYAIGLTAGERIVDLFGLINGQWAPCWELQALSDTLALRVEFTPSFVHAGSATAHVGREGKSICIAPTARNGYECEWLAIHAAVEGDRTAIPPLSSLIDDLRFAASIADQASLLVAAEASA